MNDKIIGEVNIEPGNYEIKYHEINDTDEHRYYAVVSWKDAHGEHTTRTSEYYPDQWTSLNKQIHCIMLRHPAQHENE